MKFLFILLTFFLTIALVVSQNYFGNFASRFKSLDLVQPSASSQRDPRQDRGPVLFPPSPPNAVDESSGVVVGASGYGFVPPQQSQTYYSTISLETPDASYTTFNYYNSPYSHQYNYY